MPHGRGPLKGSFGDHFEELVKLFPDKSERAAEEAERRRRSGRGDEHNIHDLLFASAWRRARNED